MSSPRGHEWLWRSLQRVARLLLLVSLLCLVLPARAEVPRFTRADKTAARQQMLDLLKPRPQPLVFKGYRSADPATRRFLDYLRKELAPVWDEYGALNREYSALRVARDRALYKSAKERQAWQKREDEISEKLAQHDADKAYQAKIKKWAALSKGLNGELAGYARELAADIERNALTPPQAKLVTTNSKIGTRISDIANNSPWGAKLGATSRKVRSIVDEYYGSKIGFDKAWRAVEALEAEGSAALGQDIAVRGARDFDDRARTLSQLAKSKGYGTWAEYQVDLEAKYHAPGFRTANERITFLRRLLKETEPVYRELLESQLRRVGGPALSELKQSQLDLLDLRDPRSTRKYFPQDRLVSIWRQAMRESGFSERLVGGIDIDAYPRRGKQTHAYMWPIDTPEAKSFVVDARRLDVKRPRPTRRSYFDPSIYIVQNLRNDGLGPLSTMFHEGGHGLDFSSRINPLGRSEGYGYSETASMSMEGFLNDRAFLLANGRTRRGKAIPAELVDTFLRDDAVNRLGSFRRQVGLALFDLELWNHDYSKGGESFVDRARRLFGERMTEATLAKGSSVKGVDWRNDLFATDHFYGGGVMYFGYIVADIAAQATMEALHGKLKQTTGRDTLYKQRGIAKMLVDGYYRRGFEKPFPQTTEEFTGQKFSAESFAKQLIRPVREYLDSSKTPVPR